MSNNIPRDPNRIKYPFKELGKFLVDDSSIDNFLSEIKQTYDEIVERYKDNEPTNIRIETYIEDDNDGGFDVNYRVYANIIESVSDYEHRMKSIKEADEAEERRIARRAESEAISEQVFKEAREKKERERLQAIVLSADPELEEYERLKAKFKIYDASKRNY